MIDSKDSKCEGDIECMKIVGESLKCTVDRQREEIAELKEEKDGVWRKYWDLRDQEQVAITRMYKLCETMDIAVLDGYTLADMAKLVQYEFDHGYGKTSLVDRMLVVMMAFIMIFLAFIVGAMIVATVM